MRVLAIETASRDLGVALVGEEGTLASFRATGSRRHVELLLPSIQLVLDTGGTSVDELDGVVVDTGPGLFTGLRAGVAAAKGLALGGGLVTLGVSSTKTLRAAAQIFPGHVAAALDVRRGEVASELPGDDAARITPMGEVIERLDALARSGEVLLVGNGWSRERDTLRARYGANLSFAGTDFDNPSAEVLGRVGLAMVQQGLGVSAAELGVNYLRAADAAITWTTRAAMEA